MKSTKITKAISLSLTMILVLQLTGCGTIFYPERKGHKGGGEIDPVVAIADAIGLLFFLVPGVIAFAVDFSNGTIYMSHGHRRHLSATELKDVTKDGKVNNQVLNKILTEKLGQPINVDASNVQIKKFDSADSFLAYFSKMQMQFAGL